MTNSTKAFLYQFDFTRLEKNVVVSKKFLIDFSDVDDHVCFEMRIDL